MSVLKVATPRNASASKYRICFRIKWLYLKTNLKVKGSRIKKAVSHRKYPRVTGGIISAIPLPRTKLPDQKRVLNIRNKYAMKISFSGFFYEKQMGIIK